MAEICGGKWWAWQGLNLRPLRCQGRDTASFRRKTAVFDVLLSGIMLERSVIPTPLYRSFTALLGAG